MCIRDRLFSFPCLRPGRSLVLAVPAPCLPLRHAWEGKNRLLVTLAAGCQNQVGLLSLGSLRFSLSCNTSSVCGWSHWGFLLFSEEEGGRYDGQRCHRRGSKKDLGEHSRKGGVKGALIGVTQRLRLGVRHVLG